MLGRLLRRPRPSLTDRRPEVAPPIAEDPAQAAAVAAAQRAAEQVEAERRDLEEMLRQHEAERQARAAEINAQVDRNLSENPEQFLKNSRQLGGE